MMLAGIETFKADPIYRRFEIALALDWRSPERIIDGDCCSRTEMGDCRLQR